MDAAGRVRAALSEGIKAAGLPGAAAAARLPNGEAVEAAAGVRGADNPAPMTPDTQFWIASCTKALTAVAAVQLVEAGLVGLDDPLGGHLPGVANPQILQGFDDAGQPRLVPATQPVTLRRLLTHTSGYAYPFTSPNLVRYVEVTGANVNGAEAPLVFEPGTGWVYGIGIDWAGQLVQALSGQPFATYLRDRVLTPLGMDDTGFFPQRGTARPGGLDARPRSRRRRRDHPLRHAGGALFRHGRRRALFDPARLSEIPRLHAGTRPAGAHAGWAERALGGRG